MADSSSANFDRDYESVFPSSRVRLIDSFVHQQSRGLLTEADVNNALTNTLTVQMRLGMFDGEPSAQPFAHLGPRDVCSPAHQDLALQAARQGIVLLQNRARSLPLSTARHRTIAVIGPNADATVTMIGNYAGVACGYTSPVQGIARYAKTIHQAGCIGVACTSNQQFGAAIGAAAHADATVLVMGLDQSIEAEARDRTSVLLPGHQQELISKVALASRGPTILVLMCGGPVDVTFAKNDPKISAIIWVGYPGQAGGTAIADVIFGTTNPGLHIDVMNKGKVDGSHTVLVFSTPPEGTKSPEKQLIGFKRIHVLAGSKQRVKMNIHVCKHLSRADEFGVRMIPVGEHTLHIGDDLKHKLSLHIDLGK
uniref:Fibronectin type III-like domain-containing protein n=1 Tax=Chenopodium quinoa TaxID=63459 RepID=A0A803NAF7_CHEQI